MATTIEKQHFEPWSDTESLNETGASELLPENGELAGNKLIRVRPRNWPKTRDAQRIKVIVPTGSGQTHWLSGAGASFQVKSKHRILEEIRVLDALKEIREFATLEDNWDLEGALAIDAGAVSLARTLLLLADIAARQSNCRWRHPEVAPDPEGGIDLFWQGEGRQVTLLARPGQTGTVDCVIKSTDTKPVRISLSISDAVTQVLWALGKEG